MSIVVNSKIVEMMLKGLPKKLDSKVNKALAATAERGIGMILDRTAKGIGINGRFAAYSPGYANAKKQGWDRSKNRRAFNGDPSGKVNLQVHNNMLSSMRSQVNMDQTAEIKFSRLSEAKKAAWNNQKRPFFGFNQREKRYLRRFFGKYIKL